MEQRKSEWAHLTDYEVRQIIAAYYGMVAMLDECVGRLLDTLEELGVADNTIVVWSSDHGDQLGENELFLKFVMRESSVRVPLMLRVPGKQPGERNELVEHTDLFPTLCELLGFDTPSTVQGRSLAPLLGEEPAPSDWRTAVFSQIDHCDIDSNVEMIRTERWKLNLYDSTPGELYDLSRDSQEFYNLIGAEAHAATVDELYGRLTRWREEMAPGSELRK
jgi:arylsulfatase A-like enzyme